MKRNYTPLIIIIFILAVLALIYATLMPRWISKGDEALSEFSTDRALEKVTAIAQKPHYVGSENHEIVAKYIQNELYELGLESTIQEGYILSDWGNLVKSKNIIARIKGTNNSKALLLLSHYDSAPHSFSKGASDDASGVATILESVRAFIYNKKTNKNDIIILFTDAEELGLNGAALFVTQHAWAKQVGLVLNFEARGSSGPSYMLMETNKGNGALVNEFAKAGVKYPVSNSLMYSIYKMLPNDTDLTVFREYGDIQGFNFAFIDNHFNYHTQQDDVKHLDKLTLSHQGTYLMPLLNYFANTNLKTLKSSEDYVYFTIPFAFIKYPFEWVFSMSIIALGLFIIALFIGTAKKVFNFKEVIKGFIPFLGAMIIVGSITFLGWKIILQIYPQYNDLLNGFTYNGHAYIGAFVLLSIAICFAFYHYFSENKATMNYYIAPLFIWIVINIIIANSLQGAGFLIIPVYCGLILLIVHILIQKSFLLLNLIFSIPIILIIAPFIQMFPIGLGLKFLFGSAILTVLTFGLLLPSFSKFRKKGMWSLLFFITSLGCFAFAGFTSGYENGKAKSNSLVYVYNADENVAKWATYDVNLDDWTKTYLGENPKKATVLKELLLPSKYNSNFTYSTITPKVDLPKPTILFLKDSIRGNQRYLKIKIIPNRKVNRYDIFANPKMVIHNFKANGVTTLGQKGSQLSRNGKKILSYYVVNNEPLEMKFNIDKSTIFDMDLLESSFDLMTNPKFNIKKRSNWMMPTPFVLNDAVIIQQKLKQTIQKPLNNEINIIVKDSISSSNWFKK